MSKMLISTCTYFLVFFELDLVLSTFNISTQKEVVRDVNALSALLYMFRIPAQATEAPVVLYLPGYQAASSDIVMRDRESSLGFLLAYYSQARLHGTQ